MLFQGSESHTSDCSVSYYPANSRHSYIPVLVCSYREGDVSLYNNRNHSSLSGEVQYSTNESSLAFICTDSWSGIESSVVCRQLGSTLSQYRLIPATLSYASQYSLYKQIDTLHIFEVQYTVESRITATLE